MARRLWLTVLVVAAVTAAATAEAEVLPVPDTVRHLGGVKAEQHVLRSPAGRVLGEQHAQAVIEGQRLRFHFVTRFTSGDEWEEHGELDLADGFRARRFAKTMRSGGKVVQKQDVDFRTGAVRWLVDGVEAERTVTLPPDTYIGPMLGVVLAGLTDRSPAKATFSALVFRPDPVVVTLRAEASDDVPPAAGLPASDALRLRVRADLGPVKNVLFARLIPTHYFWFARTPEAPLLAFEGRLGNGVEVVMTPGTPATTTARR